MLTTVDEIIEAIGGNDAACALVGVTRPAVSMWKAYGRIPSKYWPSFEKKLPGLPANELFGFPKIRGYGHNGR